MKILLLEETDSTNIYVSVHADSLDDMTLVAAHSQTAGRGQRGNSWESEPGRNICATLFHRPAGVPARVQFAVSEATALGVADMLAHYGIEARVKWPNDVYVGDRKICGILIENAVAGCDLLHCRIGIGLNVNQTVFRSDAPNPVSMAMLLGAETPLSDALAAAGGCGFRRGPRRASRRFPRPSVAWRRQTLSLPATRRRTSFPRGDRHGGSRRIHHSDRR